MHLVIDKVTGNILGEHDSYVEAKSHVLRLTAAEPSAAHDLVVLSDGRAKAVPRDELRKAAEARDQSAHVVC